MEPLTTSAVRRDGVTVLAVGGEIDLATAPALEKAIDDVLSDDPLSLIFDLTKVTFLASVGLQLLVATQERMADSAQFAVVADGPATSRPIQLTDLDKIFSLYPTLDEALAEVRRRPRLA